MAVGATQAFREGILRVTRGDLLFLSNTMKAAVLDVTYTPDLDAHDNWDDVSAFECGDADYGQLTLGSKTITEDGSGRSVFDCADLNYGDDVTIAGKYICIFKDTGTPATSTLLFLIDLDEGGSVNKESTESDFDLAISATGLYRITP